MTAALLVVLFCLQSAQAEGFADLMLGPSMSHPTDIRAVRPSQTLDFYAVPVNGEDFVLPPHYLLRVGYFFEGTPSLGLSVGLLHLKLFTQRDARIEHQNLTADAFRQGQTSLGEHFDRFSITHGYNHIPVELAFRFPFLLSDRFPQGRLQPYASAGPSVLIVHPEIAWKGKPLEQGDFFGGLGLNVALGGRFFLWKHLALVAEYRFSASEADFELASELFAVSQRTHHFLLGLGTRTP